MESQRPLEKKEEEEEEEGDENLEKDEEREENRGTTESTPNLCHLSLGARDTITECGRTEVILLGRVPVKQKEREDREERRIIELDDKGCKMALRKELGMTSKPDQVLQAEYEEMDILQRLPADTIIIKQEVRYKDDSDYVRESTENSSGSSTTSGYAAGKVKKIHRAIRKKNRTMEVRRNPMRGSKKENDKSFSRPRQRLLSDKRKEGFFEAEINKRSKLGTMPYMNTRSVTRKMYNVGATYQAPTKMDETEWKEWPVHGMHERPVFHPQVGLAVEYLGKYYTSSDGLSYNEIIEQPEIEVVSVDPHCEWTSSERKRGRKSKSKSRDVYNSVERNSYSFAAEKKSFGSCAHNSIHCVLGYCSRMTTSGYQIEDKNKLKITNKGPLITSDRKETNFFEADYFKKDTIEGAQESNQKKYEDGNLFEGYAIAMSQSLQSNDPVKSISRPTTQKIFLAEPQKPSIVFGKNFQSDQFKFQEIVRPPKNSLILVKTTEPMAQSRIFKPLSNDLKLDDVTNDETLMEMSSVYKNFIPGDQVILSRENSSIKSVSRKQTTNRPIKPPEFMVTRCLFTDKQRNLQENQKLKENEERRGCYQIKSKDVANNMTLANSSRNWGGNETSEIARILSEYNRSTVKKPAIQNQITADTKPNILRASTSNSYNKKAIPENMPKRNVDIKFPQGKWRRFHFTVEKLRDSKIVTDHGNYPQTSTGNFQTRRDQPNLKILDTNQQVTQFYKTLGVSQKTVTRGSSERKFQSVNPKEKPQPLQELLENTAVLYCATSSTRQDDIASYIGSLDVKQSIQWLEKWNHNN